MNELEKRLQRLEDIEAIKQLKYTYLRTLDTHQWDALGKTLTEDVVCSFSDGLYTFNGRQAMLDFMKQSEMGDGNKLIGLHQVHQPEIEVSADEAIGHWSMHVYLLHKTNQTGFRQFGFYKDKYVRINNQWLIKETGYQRVLEETWDIKDLPTHQLIAG